jgi:macrolide transport system ATP-binding/permease protein
MPTLDGLWHDLRYTIRIWGKNPCFTAIILLVLAVGIAANTAVFSVVSAILLRPLPGIADPGRLVSLLRIQNGDTFDNMGYPDYRDYRDRNQSLLGLAAHGATAVSFSYAGIPERMICNQVTGNYFGLLGVQPAAGRLLVEPDDAAAVISFGLWRRRFGGSPGVIGAAIELNGNPFTIVGVAEKGFRGTMLSQPFDLWVPLRTQPRTSPALSAGIMENRSAGWLFLFGRLKPGAGLRLADAEMKTIAAQLARAYPLTNGKRTVGVAAGVGMYPDDRAGVSGLLGLLSGAVAVLLLIACSNVAGMLMVRATGRTREIGIRLAVGASRTRLLHQLLTEGLMLSLAAGGIGVLLAAWLVQAGMVATHGIAPALVRHSGAHIDGTVLTFTLLASLATGLLCALLPAIQSLKVDLTSSLKSGLPGAGVRRTRLRSALVIGQVALSLVLLSGAGFLLRGLYRIVSANPGFDSQHVAMATVDLSLARYSEEKGLAFFSELLNKLNARPGVVSASLAGSVPPTEWPGAVSIFHPGEEPAPEVLQAREFELGLRVNINHVAPNYFRTLGIPLLQGRDFTDRDRTGAPGVVIVSRKLAEKMWPGGNPIGKQISYPSWQGPRRPPFEVIGVAADVKHLALTSDAPLLLYVPIFQEFAIRASVVLRTSSDPHAGIVEIQHALAATDKHVAAAFAETGPEHSSGSLWQQRLAAESIGAFSVMALLLAAVGLYTVIAQSVAQRTREVGIRLALGADRGSVVALVIKQGMRLSLAGLCAGFPAAIGFNGLVQRYLTGMQGRGLVSLAAISVLIALVMLAACWIPALRAARVDPIEALRGE